MLLNACKSESFVIINDEIKVNVEVADTSEKRATGLMFREVLDEESGMLFVFQWQDYYSFWMKNTLIPLDMIWISEDMEIVDIQQTEPCKENPCSSYKPNAPGKYVLEVNQGFASRNNIEIGDKIVLDLN